MALQKDWLLPSGLTAPGSYVRIEGWEVVSRPNYSAAVVRISIYKDKSTSDASGTPAGAVRVQLEGADFNWVFVRAVQSGEVGVNALTLRRLYTWLKTQTSYADATDVA